MKKSGTPIAAGPGRENEKVGFDGEGTPPAPRGGGGAGAPDVAWLLALPLPPPVPDVPTEPELELGFCECVLEVGACVDWLPELVLVVVVGVLDVLGVLGALGALVVGVGVDVGVLGGGVLVVGGALVVVGAGVQLTPTTVAPAGTEIADGAMPGGKSRFRVSWMPPRSVMLTVHGSAEAGWAPGNAATPITARAVTAPTTSFRLRGTVANLLPRVWSSKSWAPRPPGTWPGSY